LFIGVTTWTLLQQCLHPRIHERLKIHAHTDVAYVPGTAWKSKPSWYIVATNDRTVQPELERFVAKRMGATIYEVASSHVPMLSNPKLVIDVIRTAANA